LNESALADSVVEMISQAELDAVLETLARDQNVNLGVGEAGHRAWFRAQVVSHDADSSRVVLTCFMDHASDHPLAPGQRVVVATTTSDGLKSVPMEVEVSSGGPEARVQLRMIGLWQAEDERRNQMRIQLSVPVTRARRWLGGAWHEVAATVVDLSSRGVGVTLDQQVHVGDRLSLAVPLTEGTPDLRVTFEVRHVRPEGFGRPPLGGTLDQASLVVQSARQPWRAGGLFRNLSLTDHERVIRFIFAELRARR
jgi:hypothetical protein